MVRPTEDSRAAPAYLTCPGNFVPRRPVKWPTAHIPWAEIERIKEAVRVTHPVEASCAERQKGRQEQASWRSGKPPLQAASTAFREIECQIAPVI